MLMGNITNDPDLRFTPSGSAVLSFGMATNRRYKKGEEWVDDVTYHNIVVWGQRAQSLAQRVKKGTRVLVMGRLQTRSWDGQDGKKQYKTEVVSDEVNLIARYNEGPMSGGPAAGGAPMGGMNGGSGEDIMAATGMKPASSISKKSAPAEMDEPMSAGSSGDTPEIDPDELPF